MKILPVLFSIILKAFPFFALANADNYKLITANSEHAGYFVHLPDAYENNQDTNYPLILFLHGIGERDTGGANALTKILKWGPPRIISQMNQAYRSIHPYRFVVLAPQVKSPATSWSPKEVDDFLNYALKTYNIDENRIYLTGISMGGNGAWKYAYSSYNQPNRIAAMVPIAGWGEPSQGCIIAKRSIPVWAFHGMNDRQIPLMRGKQMFNAVTTCNSASDPYLFRFSQLNTGHNAWSSVYNSVSDSLSIYRWFSSITLDKDTIIENNLDSAETWKNPPSLNVEMESLGQLPKTLNETSGLVFVNGKLWSQNDSGNEPILFEISRTGSIEQQLLIQGTRNFDWEDLASDQKGNIYIGDIGNNLNVRKKLFIYKVKNSGIASSTLEVETISFKYEDQKTYPPTGRDMHYDAESLIHYEGALYIFTKNRTEPFTGYTHIYKIPDVPGDYTAELADSLKLGEGVMTNYWLTGAAINSAGDQIALLSHDKIWLLSCFNGKKFSDGNLLELRLNSYSQKEGIEFIDSNTLIISDERIRNILGGNLYQLKLPPEVNNSCD